MGITDEKIEHMKDIAIYGAGGFGREVACLIRRINEAGPEPVWNFIGFFDDNSELKGKQISHFGPCLGGIEALNSFSEELAVAMAIGSPIVVKKIVDEITNSNISFPNLVDKSFYLVDPETFQIGKGNIIQGSGAASCDVSIGDFNVFNGGVVMGHDAHIGSFNIIMPATRISGEVEIGQCNFLGVGSIVLQQIKIGNNICLGAGSVLMTNPRDGRLYMGNPARKTEF